MTRRPITAGYTYAEAVAAVDRVRAAQKLRRSGPPSVRPAPAPKPKPGNVDYPALAANPPPALKTGIEMSIPTGDREEE
ncbi:MAG: hypothetical protein OEV94_12110 [Deltaproteobacteria bacterium]|nr:hypothetical protein [Deltaproteobacteria bacterium]